MDGCNSRDAQAPRRLSRHVSRVLLHRGLPGTLVVFAALSVPEFSVGAGDFGPGRASDLDPAEPLVSRLQPRPPRWAGLVDGAPHGAADQQRRAAGRSARAPVLAASAPVELPVAAPGPPSPERVAFEGHAEPSSGPSLAAVAARASELSVPPASDVPDHARYGLASLAEVRAGSRGSFASLLPQPELAGPAIPEPRSPALAMAAPAVGAGPASQRNAAQPGAIVARPRPVGATAPVLADRAAAPAQMAVAGTAPAAAPAARIAAAAAAVTPQPVPGAGAAPSPAQRLGVPNFDTKAQLVTRIDGKTAGTVDFRQTPGGLQVRIGSVVDVLADRYDTAGLARIRASSAADTYVSLAQLQGQGIPISYDPVYDEFNVGLTDTRPKAARKVHIDQISTPERGSGAIGIDQVRR